MLEPTGRVRHPRLGAARVVGGILGKLVRGTSVKDLVQAIAGGQYTSPEGLFYGGSGPEQPVLELARMFAERIGAYDRGAVLDLHTGYGPRGAGMLLPADASSAAVAQALVGGPQREAGILLANEPQGGMYNPSGTVLGFLGQQLTDQQRGNFAWLGVEHGTLGASLPRKLQTLAIMVLENQGSQHGYATDQAKATVARWFQELFNPADALWQARVLHQHDLLLDAIVQRNGTGEGGPLSAVR